MTEFTAEDSKDISDAYREIFGEDIPEFYGVLHRIKMAILSYDNEFFSDVTLDIGIKRKAQSVPIVRAIKGDVYMDISFNALLSDPARNPDYWAGIARHLKRGLTKLLEKTED